MIWLELIEDGAWEDDWDYECLFCGGERRREASNQEREQSDV